ncbi:MAG: hypothetical protein HDR09_22390 [Lachnospiraceae bacterium]|nr:hypothetical protein [Lachnospiraceae bacterium]MBD5506429.1 hypothetical protein [Lachnospiraceae bacterium]
MNEKERFSMPTTGGISLLVVFAVLCLTVFALMSLSKVQADKRMADASLQAVSDYYAADCEAWRILALLLEGEVPEDVTQADGIYAYSCPISETQNLKVEVSLDGKQYTILRWQTVSEREESGGEGMGLWDGTLPF